MRDNLKNFIIPFILLFSVNLVTYTFISPVNYGGGLNPHLGILFLSGLFFGPWGSIGAVLANALCDLYRGYDITLVFLSLIVSFAVSYLPYKLWYTKNLKRVTITKPRLYNISNFTYFLGIIIFCAVIYSCLTVDIMEFLGYVNIKKGYINLFNYFINFMNYSLMFSLVGMVLLRFKDFSYTPKVSSEAHNSKIYDYMEIILPISIVIFIVEDFLSIINFEITFVPWLIVMVLLYLYIRIPIKQVKKVTYISVTERIMNYFVVVLLAIIVVENIFLFSTIDESILNFLLVLKGNNEIIFHMVFLDLVIILIYIPLLFVLKYNENNVINPVMSFSKIKDYVGKNKKIESEKVLDLYSNYIDQEDEIGILSRSYTDLINMNNDYIENLKTLEGEKQRTNAELNIAHNIQSAALPKKFLDDEFIFIDGFSKQAKLVGGDFYDFYDLDDENTVIIIGDASGKGVPASIFTLITQIAVKLLIRNDNNPSKVFCDLNDLITDSNSEMFFITLFLGIFNKKSHVLTYANAGHNPPLIKKNGRYQFMDLDSEIVMGIMEDYEYSSYTVRVDEELLLYTDGITDAQNKNKELYGEERLMSILNDKDGDVIKNVVEAIEKYSIDEEQFDDMTLLLKVKQ